MWPFKSKADKIREMIELADELTKKNGKVYEVTENDKIVYSTCPIKPHSNIIQKTPEQHAADLERIKSVLGRRKAAKETKGS
jgi:hypothetical protein